jgi:hypothetical protein
MDWRDFIGGRMMDRNLDSYVRKEQVGEKV